MANHFIFLFSVLFFIQEIQSATVVYDLNAYYFEASPDGVKKQVLGVNGQFPGPTIRAKLGDTLIVRVTNSIQDADGHQFPTSVHWHGLEQTLSPWYDGPEAVTQCPIPYGESMEYKFRLNQAGTYWYHSHHSWQYVEGFWGILIVENTPEIYWYDDEFTLAFMDWHHTPAKILGDLYHNRTIGTPVPDSGLINGRGTHPCPTAISNGFECDPDNQFPELITVSHRKTYRVRVINTSARSNFNFSIDGHKLLGIEVDGVDTVIVGPVDSVVIWPAQRYSFLVTMNGNLDQYWIRGNMSVLANGVPQPKGILRYTNRDDFRISSYSARTRSNGDSRPATQGRPSKHDIDWEQLIKDSKAGRQSVLFDAERISYNFPKNPPFIDRSLTKSQEKKYLERMTNISFPISEPIDNPVFLDQNLCRPISRGYASAPDYYDVLIVLNATFDVTENAVHGKINGAAYKVDYKPVIVQMLKNQTISPTSNPQYTPLLRQVVQIVINNQNGGDHPWHLHGHTAWVLGTGEAGTATNMNNYDESRDKDKLNIHGVRRDTTHTAPYSWTVLRYETDNPGAWLFHCHINWHLEIGLGAVFIEGVEELQELLTMPAEARRVCKLNGIEV